MVVFIWAPAALPVYKHNLLAIISALLAGFSVFFLLGDLSIDAKLFKHSQYELSLKAGSGLAIFVLVLIWWFSAVAPVTRTSQSAKPDETDMQSQVLVFLQNLNIVGVKFEQLFIIKDIKKVNGLRQNQNTYIAVFDYHFITKMHINDVKRLFIQDHGVHDVHGFNGFVGRSGFDAVQMLYGQFRRGQSFKERRKLVFRKTENGWRIANNW